MENVKGTETWLWERMPTTSVNAVKYKLKGIPRGANTASNLENGVGGCGW